MSDCKAYFLRGDSYVRYDVDGDAVDPGYPRRIGDGWRGSATLGCADDVDAVLDLGQGKLYFFKDGNYFRFDSATNSADPGYPASVADNWKGLADAGFADGIDAAVNWGDGAVFFFRGSEYLQYDIAEDQVTAGPFAITDGWAGLGDAGFGDGVDAVVSWGNGKAYFFKEDRYLRWDMADGSTDEGYPAGTADGWPTLGTAGFAADLSTAFLRLSPSPAGGGGGGGSTGGADDLTDGFFTGLKDVCGRLGCGADDMLAVMMSESGVKPSAQNPNGKATGLIQFMPATLVRLGWADGPDAFAQLSAEDQLPYVEQYFKPYARHGLGSSGRLYQATFLPGTLSQGSDPATVVCAADGPHATAYAANKGLDIDQNGQITVGDLTARTDRMRTGGRWNALMARLAAT